MNADTLTPLPMLATSAAPFDDPRFQFEVKWDGVRALAAVNPGGWRLWGRQGVLYTARYPELAVLRRLPTGTVVDGELVVGRQGRADFPALLQRHHRRLAPVAGTWDDPVHYMLFDLLAIKGTALLKEPLVHRRELLQEMLAKVREPVLEFSAGVVGGGRDFFARVIAQGHEGVMAKDLASRYSPGKRSSAWRKIKPVAVIPCVVVGYMLGREGVRRLLLATLRDGTLRYVGTIGQGLGGPEIRRKLARRLEALRRSGPAVSCLERALWVEPRVYCQVRFHGWTLAGHLRHAVFCGWLSGDSQR